MASSQQPQSSPNPRRRQFHEQKSVSNAPAKLKRQSTSEAIASIEAPSIVQRMASVEKGMAPITEQKTRRSSLGTRRAVETPGFTPEHIQTAPNPANDTPLTGM